MAFLGNKAGLLTAVASAFIVDLQSQLQPDYTQLGYEVLWMMANSTGLRPPDKPSSDSPWNGPDSRVITTQVTTCVSFGASLLAACFALIIKVLLNIDSPNYTRESLVSCGRTRQLKVNGLLGLRLKRLTSCLPMFLIVAFYFLLLTLFEYLSLTSKATSNDVSAFLNGFLVVLLILLVLPFFPQIKRFMGYFTCFGRPDEKNENEDIPLTTVGPPNPPPVPFGKEVDRKGYVLDSNCIAWMFKMSMDPDAVQYITKFIPEIIWHNGIRTTPLEQLYDTVVDCFDYSTGSPVLAPKLRDKAYLGAKALVHLGIQRKCMGNEPDTIAFASISSRHTVIGSGNYEGGFRPGIYSGHDRSRLRNRQLHTDALG